MAGIDLNSLMGLVGGDGVEAIAKATKTDKSKVSAVLGDALPVLVGKMSDNASTKDGAKSLNKALNEHKTGDVIDVASFLSTADSKDGKKILGHILGSDEAAATKAISKKSGVSSSFRSSATKRMKTKRTVPRSAGSSAGSSAAVRPRPPAGSARRFSARCSAAAARLPRPPAAARCLAGSWADSSAATRKRRKKRRKTPRSWAD